MADYTYVLFDTVPFGVVASTEHVLFQAAEGSDSVHTKQYTNMKGAGSLPNQESFVVNSIHLVLDDIPPEADLELVYSNNWLEFKVSDKVVLRAPLRLFASHSAFGGHFTQAAAANRMIIGADGMGFPLDLPIMLEGGASFRVSVWQNTALGVALNAKLCLRGKLTQK